MAKGAIPVLIVAAAASDDGISAGATGGLFSLELLAEVADDVVALVTVLLEVVELLKVDSDCGDGVIEYASANCMNSGQRW